MVGTKGEGVGTPLPVFTTDSVFIPPSSSFSSIFLVLRSLSFKASALFCCPPFLCGTLSPSGGSWCRLQPPLQQIETIDKPVDTASLEGKTTKKCGVGDLREKRSTSSAANRQCPCPASSHWAWVVRALSTFGETMSLLSITVFDASLILCVCPRGGNGHSRVLFPSHTSCGFSLVCLLPSGSGRTLTTLSPPSNSPNSLSL